MLDLADGPTRRSEASPVITSRRFFTIDLGSAVVDVNQHGVAEAIEALQARRGAVNAFAQDATSTAVKDFIIEVCHSGSTTQHAK